MNNVLSLARAVRDSAHPFPTPRAAALLPELLSLHEEMVEQLRVEKWGMNGSSDFLSTMIEQHEQAIVTIRAQIELDRSETEERVQRGWVRAALESGRP
jgi:hypothetical protein